MNEFLSRAVQAELERKQREEEDALYRSFIKGTVHENFNNYG